MRKPFMLAFVVLIICASTIVNVQAIRGEISATLTTPQSERFSINKEFWAFAGSYLSAHLAPGLEIILF